IHHIGIREPERGRYDGIRDVDYVTGCAVLARMSTVAEIGDLDETYLMYNEDTDWCARCLAAGHAVVTVSRAKMWHKVSLSSGGGLTEYKIYNRLRSTLRFFSLHARPYHWLGIVPATIARALWFAVAQLLSGRPGNAAAVARGTVDSATRRKRTL
ncbi:MAG: glycosyltransferase family 2 protein, partial [Candidatus Eisenbacteria bacterium]|nr:glycosyltransferase family 2 protein [Candidatus Eisenbacteria bacterium]